MPMRAPAHPGELIRENMAAVGWSITEAVERLEFSPADLDDVLAGRARVAAPGAGSGARGVVHGGVLDARPAGYDLAEARQRKSAA